jgi:hypothetical protein
MTKWNANRRKQPENLPEAATDSTPKPGDYALGSMKSRAAARAILKEKKQEVIRVHFVASDGNGHPKIPGTPLPEKPYRIDYWSDGMGRTEYYSDEDDCDEKETDGRPS